MSKTTKALFLSSIILLPTVALANPQQSQPQQQQHQQQQSKPQAQSQPQKGLEHVSPMKDFSGFNNKQPDRGQNIGNGKNNSNGHSRNDIADLATVAVIGGLTYYILDNVFYQKQNNNYVVVQTPPNYVQNSSSAGEPTQIDYQGKRYYVKDNRFYQRDMSGTYIEVPKPAGL